MPAALILNPSAGGADPQAVGEWAAARRIERFTTQKPGDAFELARRLAAEYRNPILAAGGDGTVHQVVNGMADAAAGKPIVPTLGVIPLGTGNDFARTLGIPLDLAGALRVIDAGRTRRVDLIESLGTYPKLIVNSVTLGVAGQITHHLGRRTKSWLGPLVYAAGAAARILQRRYYRARIVADGQRYRFLTPSISLTNGSYLGGGVLAAPGAAPDDGMLELLVITAIRPRERLRLAVQYLRGRHERSPLLVHLRVRRATIQTRRPMAMSVDGEPAPAHRQVVLEIRPAALRVIVP